MDEKVKTFSRLLEPKTHQKPGRPKYVGPRDVYGLVGGDTPHMDCSQKSVCKEFSRYGSQPIKYGIVK